MIMLHWQHQQSQQGLARRIMHRTWSMCSLVVQRQSVGCDRSSVFTSIAAICTSGKHQKKHRQARI